jgi:CheY-like chemotaxis protein
LERAAGERVTITTKDESKGAMAAVDSSQIELVLLNLVVNARDAMPEGGNVTISASTQTFERHTKDRPPELTPGDYCKLSVSDTGTGIDNEAMPRVFEPFFTTKDVGSGTGLGLAAVYGAIHQHEGVVTIETELGVGTTFAIYLPLCDSALVERKSPAEPATIGGREKILLVEDDALVRSVTVRTLEELGYNVVSVSTAEQALDHIDEIDLILTDVRLPRMPGTRLAELVASDHPTLPIVLMSGLVEDNEQKRVIESERFLFLSKPFTPTGLAKRIREALGD